KVFFLETLDPRAPRDRLHPETQHRENCLPNYGVRQNATQVARRIDSAEPAVVVTDSLQEFFRCKNRKTWRPVNRDWNRLHEMFCLGGDDHRRRRPPNAALK